MESSSNTLGLSDQAINSHLFNNLRPLPQDILEMSQEDTACQYCGISYLLLTKYEKMQAQVHKMEQELKELQTFAAERPGLLSKLETALKDKNQSEDRLEEMEKNLESCKINSERDSANSARLEKELEELNSNLARERLERKNQSSHLKRKNKLLGNLIQEINLEIIQITKYQQERLKKQSLDFEGLMSSLKDEWSEKCLEFLNRNLLILRTSLENMHANNLGILKNEINDLQGSIENYKKEIKEINSSKAELQDRLEQSNSGFKLQLERSNSENLKHNSRILELEHELKILKDKSDEHSKQYAILHTNLEKAQKEAEYQQKSVLEQLMDKNKEISQLQEQLTADRKSSEAVQSLATQAGVGLAKKDEKILSLENIVKSLKEQVKSLTVEREQTIEAHQSRVKQLQDHFLEQIKQAGKEETEKANEKIKRVMIAEKEAAINEWTKQLQEDFDSRAQLLKDQTLVVKEKYNELKKQMLFKEEEWKKKCEILIEKNKKAQDSNAADFEHYQTRIRTLESEIIKNQAAPAADGPHPSLQEVIDLKAIVEKRNAEISFLKDTVRLECEERISLIAKLALLTQNGTIPVQESPKLSESQPQAESISPVKLDDHKIKSHNSSPSTPVRKNFEQMMHEAAVKKGKKLAKSSSRKKLFGI